MGGLKAENERLRGLLREARESVRYQMGMQNLNHEAGRRHYEEFEGRIQRIDAALSQQAEPKCRTCSDVGILGHSEVCPECADTWGKQAEPARAQGEREAFELFAVLQGWDIGMFTPPSDGEYRDARTQATWEAWQARATRPAQTEQQTAECTNEDSWNCKYCQKTEACKAIKDPRNFAAPIAQTAPQDTVAVLEVWDAIGHDTGCNPGKDELLASLRNMAELATSEAAPQPEQSGLVDSERAEAAFNAVITYMLGEGRWEEPIEFLRCWNEGDFDALREEWPEAPLAIYYADSLADHAAIDSALATQGDKP